MATTLLTHVPFFKWNLVALILFFIILDLFGFIFYNFKLSFSLIFCAIAPFGL